MGFVVPRTTACLKILYFYARFNSLVMNVARSQKQIRKVLWTRKALLAYSPYTYGKPLLCINIHYYAPPRTVMQQAEMECAQ